MAKYKLSLEDLESPIILGFGIRSTLGPLNLCFALNQLSPIFRFQRYSEDLYDDFRQHRFFYPVFAVSDPLREIEWRLVHNRSYRGEGQAVPGIDLFTGQTTPEKNWLNNREGFNFFLWFEGENQNVSFLHEVKSILSKSNNLGIVKELEDTELNRLNKQIKYYHGL